MHYRFLVTFDKEEAYTSEEARTYAFEQLHEEGFCENGRFASGFADWFVIGGRWSGALTRALLEREALEAVEKEFEEKHSWWISKDVREEERREEMRAIFMHHFPDFKGELPYWRGTYKSDGYEDDAMVVTGKLYERLLKPYEGRDLSEAHVDLEGDCVEPDMVGKKWLVVVDYHN